MPWTINLSRDAVKKLSSFPRDDQVRIGKAIDELSIDPLRGDVLLLKGKEWAGRYRKRVGDYRVIFQLFRDSRLIEISQILRRSEKTYRAS